MRELRQQVIGQASASGSRLHPRNAFARWEPRDVEHTIPARFAEAVSRWPQRLALKSPAEQLTYAELGARCAALAKAIVGTVGRTEESVASMFDPGVPAVTAMLGVLAAGKVLVPLDPAFPRERLDYMMRDSGARLIVTNARHMSLSHSVADRTCRVLDVDSVTAAGDDFAGVTTSPGAPASINYTSGTTGQPKGVTQNHRNLLHTVMNYTNVFHFCAEDRLATFPGPAGVALAWFSLLGLLNGACYCPIDVKERSAASIASWLDEQRVTILSAMPPVYRLFLNGLLDGFRFAHVRLAGIGGDSVQANDFDLFRRYFTADCLFSPGLGLTEVGRVTYHLMDARSELVDGHVPIGYPAEGYAVTLQDDEGGEVEGEGVGEMVIRSEFLSPGYWRRPDLTRQTFLPDPRSSAARIYRTGDLVRRLGDGCLVHMGRKDLQVKVRGHRIELPEVEAALLALPDVAETVAVGHTGSDGEKRIVAYVVPRTRPAISSAELRRALAARLPPHMIPWRLVILDRLPLTVMGKVDRGALPPPVSTRPELASAYVAPRTATERALADIWADVLDLDRVGIDDAFLDLGGDSLSAMRVGSRINARFRVEMPQAIVFELATVAELAAEIDSALAGRRRAT
jgi:amino acid adenylation domain-containing protein